jgi:hypothetical protein
MVQVIGRSKSVKSERLWTEPQTINIMRCSVTDQKFYWLLYLDESRTIII